MNKALSEKKPEPNPIKMSLVKNPKNIENKIVEKIDPKTKLQIK